MAGGGAEVEVARWRRERSANGTYMVALADVMLCKNEEEILTEREAGDLLHCRSSTTICSTAMMHDDNLLILIAAGQIVCR